MKIGRGLPFLLEITALSIAYEGKSWCRVAPVKEDRIAHLSCFFNEDVSSGKKNIEVRQIIQNGNSVKLVTIHWKNGTSPYFWKCRECKSDFHVTTELNITVENITEAVAFVCYVVPAEEGSYERCSTSPDLISNDTVHNNTSEPTEINSKDGQEGQQLYYLFLLLILPIVFVIFCLRKRTKLLICRTSHSANTPQGEEEITSLQESSQQNGGPPRNGGPLRNKSPSTKH